MGRPRKRPLPHQLDPCPAPPEPIGPDDARALLDAAGILPGIDPLIADGITEPRALHDMAGRLTALLRQLAGVHVGTMPLAELRAALADHQAIAGAAPDTRLGVLLWAEGFRNGAPDRPFDAARRILVRLPAPERPKRGRPGDPLRDSLIIALWRMGVGLTWRQSREPEDPPVQFAAAALALLAGRASAPTLCATRPAISRLLKRQVIAPRVTAARKAPLVHSAR